MTPRARALSRHNRIPLIPWRLLAIVYRCSCQGGPFRNAREGRRFHPRTYCWKTRCGGWLPKADDLMPKITIVSQEMVCRNDDFLYTKWKGRRHRGGTQYDLHLQVSSLRNDNFASKPDGFAPEMVNFVPEMMDVYWTFDALMHPATRCWKRGLGEQQQVCHSLRISIETAAFSIENSGKQRPFQSKFWVKLNLVRLYRNLPWCWTAWFWTEGRSLGLATAVLVDDLNARPAVRQAGERECERSLGAFSISITSKDVVLRIWFY